MGPHDHEAAALVIVAVVRLSSGSAGTFFFLVGSRVVAGDATT